MSRFASLVAPPPPPRTVIAPAATPSPPDGPRGAQLSEQKLLDAKVRLHKELIEDVDLASLEALPPDQRQTQIFQIVSELVHKERLPITSQELTQFAAEIIDEMIGLGPLEPLLRDPTISDILINGHECVFVERKGLLEEVAVRFADEAHLLRIVNRIVADDALEAEASLVARHLCAIDPNLLKQTKRAINQTLERQGMLDALETALAIDLEIEGPGSPDKMAFMDIARADGLKAALAWRDARFPVRK